jgi:hypothetical protein
MAPRHLFNGFNLVKIRYNKKSTFMISATNKVPENSNVTSAGLTKISPRLAKNLNRHFKERVIVYSYAGRAFCGIHYICNCGDSFI